MTLSRRQRSRLGVCFNSRHVFALRQSLAGYRYYQKLIGEVDEEVQRQLAELKTAATHKLARIVFHLLNTKEAYSESVFYKCEEDLIKRAELRLRKQAATLGFQVVAVANS
jgi:hypothetical protein